MELANIPLILPAAGKSSRVGSPKGLQTHERRTWLEIQCQTYAKAGGRTVVLVLGYDRDRYLDALGSASAGREEPLSYGGCSLHLLHNLSPEYGPFSSLKRAGDWINGTTDFQAAFFLPLDTPVPSATVLQDLTAAMRPGIHVVQPRLGDRGGHPVLLSRHFLSEMSTLDQRLPESRLDLQIREWQVTGEVISVPVTDPRVVLNLNDPEAWERYFKSEEMLEMTASPRTTPGAR